MEFIKDLEEFCENLCRMLPEINNEIRNAGGKLPDADMLYVNNFAHALKSVKTTMAMEEAKKEHSSKGGYGRGMYNDGYKESAYPGGYGEQMRDPMGRYMDDGYSNGSYGRRYMYDGYSDNSYGRRYMDDGNHQMIADLERKAQMAKDEQTRRVLEETIQRLKGMR